MSKKVALLGLLVILLLWPASAAAADGRIVLQDGGQIFVDEDVVLIPGQTFEGELGVLRGNLTMPEGSTVNGDVFVVNGKATIAGRVAGNLAVVNQRLELAETGWVSGDVFGMSGDQDVAGQIRGNLSNLFGRLMLRSTAIVEGDLLVTAGHLEREAGAQVLGEQVSELRWPDMPFVERLRERAGELPIPQQLLPTPKPPESLPVPAPPEPPRLRPTPMPPEQRWPVPAETARERMGHLLGRVVTAFVLGLLLMAAGLLTASVWPKASGQVSKCIATLPWQSFGLGLLSFLIAAGLEALAIVLMIVVILVGALMMGTVILIPIGLLVILLSVLVLLPVPLALIGGIVLGWVGLAQLIGQKLLKALKAAEPSPLGATLLGLLITVAAAVVLWILQPGCCAWPYIILLTSIGLGAVIHTRFGTRSCQGQPAAPVRGAAPVEALPVEALPVEAMDEEAGRPDGQGA